MKYFKITTVLVVLLFTSYSCRVTVPENDTTPPTITVSVVENSGTEVIRSTNPNVTVGPFICPTGTADAGQVLCCYPTSIAGDSVDFRVIGTDRGGVGSISVRVLHNQVSNVRIIGHPDIVPTVANVPATNHKDIFVSFDVPRTSYILAFEVNNAGEILTLDVTTNDFSNNATSIPAVNTDEPSVQVVDLQLSCN
ncbi:hypothetical protein POV27_06280 [Aureisphaera galaxeae]|uniref:hypothetical protein n=1 Tax=Aureisphaera galaxeae TaxID=1538023 RepID=UPI002350AA94|nr:hypothetical protein [Aureisphaera galaxeae]MDC8003651.1 hypothetical protein [Aureisphaera galaxeae]